MRTTNRVRIVMHIIRNMSIIMNCNNTLSLPLSLPLRNTTYFFFPSLLFEIQTIWLYILLKSVSINIFGWMTSWWQVKGVSDDKARAKPLASFTRFRWTIRNRIIMHTLIHTIARMTTATRSIETNLPHIKWDKIWPHKWTQPNNTATV